MNSTDLCTCGVTPGEHVRGVHPPNVLDAIDARRTQRCIGEVHVCLPGSSACQCRKHVYPARATP